MCIRVILLSLVTTLNASWAKGQYPLTSPSHSASPEPSPAGRGGPWAAQWGGCPRGCPRDPVCQSHRRQTEAAQSALGLSVFGSATASKFWEGREGGQREWGRREEQGDERGEGGRREGRWDRAEGVSKRGREKGVRKEKEGQKVRWREEGLREGERGTRLLLT